MRSQKGDKHKEFSSPIPKTILMAGSTCRWVQETATVVKNLNNAEEYIRKA